MTAPRPAPLDPHTLLAHAVDRACDAVAPTWPLDRFIAVNPLWGWVDRPVEEAAARVWSLAGARLTMPLAWYREQLDAGAFAARHVAAALAERGGARTVEDVLAALEHEGAEPAPRALIADLVERRRGQAQGWRGYVRHSVSQFCASWFDEGQASFRPPATDGLYASWRRAALVDAGPRAAMGLRGYAERVRALPGDARAVIAAGVEALEIPPSEVESYLTALLMDVNGWAAWCAWRRWTARQDGGDDDVIVDLLAVRLAWEWVLRMDGGAELGERWAREVERWAEEEAGEPVAWVLQRALELATHEQTIAALGAVAPEPARAEVEDGAAEPSFQAVFCIDVRSEVIRRAVEAAQPAARTLGFAGFFGVPVAYRPTGAREAVPQLPGLLAPRLLATDGLGGEVGARRVARVEDAAAWKRFARSALSGFSFVEAAGIPYGAKLLTDALGWSRPVAAPDTAMVRPADVAARRPRLAGTVSAGERADLAAGILRGMSLTAGFARLVLLVGHGSSTVNNPHAAGLDCGACCGQTGEVNARVAAALLNDPEVREGLATRGIVVPRTTRFVPALHDTTTEEVALFDLDEVPPSHAADVAAAREALDSAAVRARAERSERFGGGERDAAALRRAHLGRARDWAEVRPEWGLAGNAAFVVAPRSRTRRLDLGGRAFLHEYRWQDDPDGARLELIMTAPMVVTHWINFQYYASTVDNHKFGSGDKVLHNVVGGRIGVFEGNGGDLRIGLSKQSLHDGARFVHQPVRLAVFIEAPGDAISAVLRRHPRVRDLVENEWILLYRFGAGEPGIQRWGRGQDRTVSLAARRTTSRSHRDAGSAS